jgi:hypothetical protein
MVGRRRWTRAPRREPGEFVEVVLMAMSEFRDHLRTGDLTDVDLGYPYDRQPASGCGLAPAVRR